MTDTLQLVTRSSTTNQDLAILALLITIALLIIILLINRAHKKKRKNKKFIGTNSSPDLDYTVFETRLSKRTGKEIEKGKDGNIPQVINNSKEPSAEPIPQMPPRTEQVKTSSGATLTNENKSIKTEKAQVNTGSIPITKTFKIRVNPKTLFVKAEEEIGNKLKFIGYEPNDFFLQSEPLNYPYVIMPRPRSVIKFPRKNKSGNKGYSEDFFLKYVTKYFKSHFKIYNDRVLIIPSKQNPYEPDITLIDEKAGINLFIDIEIDEPYDGITREPIHFRGYDKERNKFFKNRGWLTVRFAEEQVWKHAENCCKFLFHVINSINKKIIIPHEIEILENLGFIPQWTIEQANAWSSIKYRESYLGINSFDVQNTHREFETIENSDVENEIESQVNEEEINYSSTLKEAIVKQAINTGKYISCKISTDKGYTILRPKSFDGETLNCYCYVENKEREIGVKNLSDLILRDQPFLVRLNGDIGLDEIKRVVNDAIQNNKLIRMKYTRSSWTDQVVNEETGEIILNHIEAEESLRTISDVDYSINTLNEEHFNRYNLNEDDYITAYCHKRHEQRTFKFERINELEILNI